VYVEALEMGDLLLIAGAMYPQLDPAILRAMVTFNAALHTATMVDRKYACAPGL
jgi:midasin (ATPase involved in ribosome maturation)